MVNKSPVGVLVAQLGTPDAPTPKALRPYLKQFLSDPRVIDYSPLIWQPILQGIILRTRPKRSARLYQRIWLEEGSPLLVYSQQQVAGLQERLGKNYRVVLGMSYGSPSVQSAVQALEAEGITQILVLPMYPQYSSTTTASVYDAAYLAAAGKRADRKRFVPALRFIEPYYKNPSYISAVAGRVRKARDQWGKAPDRYLFSFHGIPARYIRTGDPYRAQCEETAALLAQELELEAGQWSVSFQSRFGPENWLAPYTEKVLTNFSKEGVNSVLVTCPGFVTDCLETLDELGNEGCHQFVSGGGAPENYRLVPCLNDDPHWLDTMTELVQQGAGGWV
jgi:protoporphyrin/coproporphyrin ferrochelatase